MLKRLPNSAWTHNTMPSLSAQLDLLNPAHLVRKAPYMSLMRVTWCQEVMVLRRALLQVLVS